MKHAALKVFSSRAAYDAGGMGQHFARLVEQARAAGALGHYYCSRCKAGDEAICTNAHERWTPLLIRWTPLRFSRSWSAYLGGELWDRKVARMLRGPIECAVGMNGQAEHFFRAARRLGARSLELVAATAHVNHVWRQHELCRRQHPIEQDWLSAAQLGKSLREYELADVIHVGSEYSRERFIEHGVPAQKLSRVNYPIDARFRPPPRFDDDGVFRIVYTGMILATKGVPVLIDAFARLNIANAELWLVGGTTSRPMRRWMAAARARDKRIHIAPGDPLPLLQRASAYVHPSYQDGFGYAPMEALACGVPVIVTEDTGMKEHVREGVNGYIVPTGQAEPILQRLEHLAEHPLRGRFDAAAKASASAAAAPVA
jgi:glycosyltransferase involved in cell wall biosynthesis